MAKKYVPSGYQIIDLGAHDLSSPVTINKGENADADVLIELKDNGKLYSKPVLLHIADTDSGLDVMGFCVVNNDLDGLILWVTQTSDIIVEIQSTAITIQLES